MRPIARFLTVLYVTLTLATSAAAQITFDLNVGSLAATESSSPTFFVGTGAGLFSGEGDLTQLRPVYITPAGTTQPSVSQVSIDGSNIYVQSFAPSRSIWTSRDGGQTWAETVAGLPADHELRDLFLVTGGKLLAVADETALGQATMTISTPAGSSSSPISVNATAPGLFAANATGEGVSASIAIRVAADGTQSVVDVIDTSQQPFVEQPIDLGPEGEQVVLLLYGTGIRNWQTIEVTIGGQSARVIGVAPQGEFVGLDQVNVVIPRSLIGAGVVEIRMTVDGQTTNVVTMRIQ